MYPRNTHEKESWTQKIPTRKNLEPTKYPRKHILDSPNTQEKNNSNPRNTYDKKSWNIHKKKIETHKIPTRKNFTPIKAWCHDGTRPTMARGPRNLAHSFPWLIFLLLVLNNTFTTFDSNLVIYLLYVKLYSRTS